MFVVARWRPSKQVQANVSSAEDRQPARRKKENQQIGLQIKDGVFVVVFRRCFVVLSAPADGRRGSSRVGKPDFRAGSSRIER